ncbi:hypothetical protein IW262DRAFT_1291239 [Armillaria fumosa]|nr:hypothetical protein IW262DRAFT_1291239 [Armillaria fumosa]
MGYDTVLLKLKTGHSMSALATMYKSPYSSSVTQTYWKIQAASILTRLKCVAPLITPMFLSLAILSLPRGIAILSPQVPRLPVTSSLRVDGETPQSGRVEAAATSAEQLNSYYHLDSTSIGGILLVQTMHANYTLRPQPPVLLLSLFWVEGLQRDFESVSFRQVKIGQFPVFHIAGIIYDTSIFPTRKTKIRYDMLSRALTFLESMTPANFIPMDPTIFA